MKLNIKHISTYISLFSKGLVLLCGLSLIACKKPAPKPSLTTGSFGNGIYMVGSEPSNTGEWVGKVWKDSSEIFTFGDGSNTISAGGVYVSADSNLYVCGFETIGSISNACYWENGKQNYLSKGVDAIASCIYKSSTGDLLVGGYQNLTTSTLKPIATLWKNGTKIEIDADAVIGFIVDGSDVYVQCCNYEVSGPNEIKFWKDGVFVSSLPTTSSSVGSTWSFNIGNDKYTANFNYTTSQIQLNKNGTKIKDIPTTQSNVQISSLFIHNGIHYFCGTGVSGPITTPTYWSEKGSVKIGNGKMHSSANAIFVKD